MLEIGQLIHMILKKKNMNIAMLVKRINQLEKENGCVRLTKDTRFSSELKSNAIGLGRLRKIELALGLDKFILVKAIEPTITESKLKILENPFSGHNVRLDAKKREKEREKEYGKQE